MFYRLAKVALAEQASFRTDGQTWARLLGPDAALIALLQHQLSQIKEQRRVKTGYEGVARSTRTSAPPQWSSNSC